MIPLAACRLVHFFTLSWVQGIRRYKQKNSSLSHELSSDLNSIGNTEVDMKPSFMPRGRTIQISANRSQEYVKGNPGLNCFVFNSPQRLCNWFKNNLALLQEINQAQNQNQPPSFSGSRFPALQAVCLLHVTLRGTWGFAVLGCWLFFWCGIVVKNNWYRGVAMISKLTVYDVCSFKPTVFGEINHFWCCSLSFNDDHGKAWYSPWVYMPTTVIAKPMNDSGPPGSL